MLSIRNLSKVYAGGKKAVDNMNIDIESGDFIALLERVVVENNCIKNDQSND